MIHFKCVYCGQRILAKDNDAGKKGKCPKCAHLLTVPESTKGRPAISVNKEPMPDRSEPRVPAWASGSGFRPEEANAGLTLLFKESFGFLIPTYDKLSLLLMVLTLILLYMTNNQLRHWKSNANQTSQIESGIFLAMSMLVLTYPVVLFFRMLMQKEEMELKKEIILFFTILINAGTGIIAGLYVKSNITTPTWLLVFPIWNILNGALMVCMFYTRFIDEECISDRRATPLRIFLGIIAIVTIFLFCNYVFKLYWAVTFSICMVYTTSFDRALQNVFPGLTRQEAEVEP